MNIQPATIEDIKNAIIDTNAIVVRGANSKPALSALSESATVIDMRKMSGIIEYEPGEYTFTAFAGTPLVEIRAALAENNQYLPFDPLLVQQGATLGGTVAANLSGAGRYRYGGVRDFILGVRFVDGTGRILRGGGKVVKNAAGFDLPKFFTGSLGAYGIMTELSFKVFPAPESYQTLRCVYDTVDIALAAALMLAQQPLEIHALDIEIGATVNLLIRIGGQQAAMKSRMERLSQILRAETALRSAEAVSDDTALWADHNALAWAENAEILVKVPLAPRQVPQIDIDLAQINALRHYTAGGSIAWIAGDDLSAIHHVIRTHQLAGLCLRGNGRILGKIKGAEFARRIKKVLDPLRKLPEI